MKHYSKTLLKRLVISTIIISVVYYIVVYAPFLFFIAVNAILIAIGLYEFYTILENKGYKLNKPLGIIFGSVFPLFIYFPGEGIILASAILLFSFFHYLEMQQGFEGLPVTALMILGLIYVGMLGSFFTKLKFIQDGTFWVIYGIWVTKMGDAGAYFIGTSFGKHKPLRKISPNKSVEGAIGGLTFSVASSLFFKLFLPNVSLVHLLILGTLLAIVGQLGDLAESLIKRECDVKDSGVLPGLGGVLDMMDSLLFAIPFLYYYVLVFIM